MQDEKINSGSGSGSLVRLHRGVTGPRLWASGPGLEGLLLRGLSRTAVQRPRFPPSPEGGSHGSPHPQSEPAGEGAAGEAKEAAEATMSFTSHPWTGPVTSAMCCWPHIVREDARTRPSPGTTREAGRAEDAPRSAGTVETKALLTLGHRPAATVCLVL